MRNIFIDEFKIIPGCKDDSLSPFLITLSDPQGSILGPLLFSVYVADLHNIIQYSYLKEYADDSQLYLLFALMTQNLNIPLLHCNEDLENINQFSYDQNLKLNASKSLIRLVGTNKHQIAQIPQSLKYK